MVLYTPLPDDGAVPIHATERVTLGPQEKGEIVVEPDNQSSTHFVPVVAVSKRSNATYTVEVDETTRYGENTHTPPTDPDDLTATFLRALEMEREIVITVRDVRTSGAERNFDAHILGWEA